MAGVLDYKTEIQIPCKVERELYLSDIADIHRIRRIGTQGATGIIWEDFWRKT